MINLLLLSFYEEDSEFNCKYTLASLRLAAYIQDMKDVKTEIYPLLLEEKNGDIDALIKKVEEENIDILGVSAYIWTWEKIKYICEKVKDNRKINVIIGGPEVNNRDVTAMPDNVTFIYGEGEKFLKQFCTELLECDDITSMYNKNKVGQYQLDETQNKFIILSENELPVGKPVFYEAFMSNLHIEQSEKSDIYYETTRGCPYNCGYCGHKTRKRVATFDLKFLESEIKYMKNMNIARCFIVDAILGGTPKNGKQILKLFNKYVPHIAITTFLRPEYIDEEYIDILCQSNIEEVRIGIQTMNPNVPNWIRDNDIDKIINGLPKLNGADVPWRAELIAGLPGDNVEGLMKSIQFVINHVRPSYLHIYHLTVLKETGLYSLIQRNQEHWINIDPRNMRAIESYSYTKAEMFYMVNFSALFTSLYNSYALRVGYKAKNKAPDFAALKQIVNEHINSFPKDVYLHYKDGVKYWRSIEI